MTSVKDIQASMRSTEQADLALVKKAYDFSELAHKDHARYSGEPYFTHPAAVAKLLAEAGADAETIAAGLLHDTVEDVGVLPETIETEFGRDVRFLVEGVTKLGHHKYRGAERHAESLRRLLVATSEDVRVLLVKLMDRYHNMTTLDAVPSDKRRRIALETLEIYAPIADRLGMGWVKKELEDMAFPYVDPDAYAHTREIMKQKSKETFEGLQKVRALLQRELAHAGIKSFRTDQRVKGLYSLYTKLERKKKDITQVYDVAALRVIVPESQDCYAALGVVHRLFKPLPGEIKDYIAFPKPNGYQSIHTTVVTPQAGIVEVQIRSEAMHKAAQYGIASHMSYKELGDRGKDAFRALSSAWLSGLLPLLSKKTGKVASPASPAWLKELAEAHDTLASSEEFIAGMKEDFFEHRVFVFTPNGDVVDLPLGASPLDFAYAIHSDIGNHTVGAKVNGKLVALDTNLANGDRVEILTRPSGKPNRKWLEYVKTSLARKHIRGALNEREEAAREEERRKR